MSLPLTSRVLLRLALVLAVLVGSLVLVSAPKSPFTVNDKAYYADANLINFVRPGLVVRILSVDVAADGTVRARVRFSDPRGLPLDRLGITTPGTIGASFVLARIPRGQSQYVAYTTRTQTSPITRRSAVQAAADTGGTWTQVADGEYTYTFGTRLPANYDRTVTHTVGLYSNRNLTEFDLGVNLADTVFHWVPDGSRVSSTRDVIKTATCNKCHYDISAHGNTGRKSMEVCVLCHTPQTVDPDTGNSVDMVEMTHKIHMGQALPSVAAGGKYQIVGNAQVVHDYSSVGFPSDHRNCSVCHEKGKGAAQEDIWFQKPSRVACGSCHDTVNFATGQGHVNLPQPSDALCATCHIPEGEIEFDASIKGAHTVPRESKMLGGLQFEILRVENNRAGQRPVVTFSLKDKNGAPLDIARLGRLALVLAGNTIDYTAFQTGYISENAIGASGSGGVYQYTFTNAIPADAKGTWAIAIEGRREETVLEGTTKQQTIRYGGINKVTYFSVDGSALVPRRRIVSQAKCEACHTRLILHGENRNQIDHCEICHNPVETDRARRPAAQMPAETVHMPFMVHRIHGGERLKELYGATYVVYGFGGTPFDFSHVRYPAPLNACDMCHVGGSQNVPIPGKADVNAPRQLINPMPQQSAACLACHASLEAASHALANTTRLGESCGACHGINSEFAVTKVHAR